MRGQTIERLAAAIALAQQRLAHDQRIERRDEGAHGEPVDRRRRDDREIAHARHRQLQRARDRRRRQRQHMHLGAQLLQPLLVADAEMLLLVDHDEAEVLELDGLAEHGVGADDDVDAAFGEPLLGLALLGGRDHAREPADPDRQAGEALREIGVVLPREQRRRHDDRGLLAVDRRREGCAQRDLGLAEADVAADQPIHRPARREIVDRRLDRLRLVLRLVIGEARAEFVVEPLGRNQARGGAGEALRGDAHQFARHLADALLQPRLAGLPARRTQPVEFAVLRAEAREQFQVLDGQEQPVAAGVVDLEAIVRRARRLDRLQADETADAVVDVHDEIARRQRRGLGEHILRAPLPPALPHQPIAENVLLADDGEIGGLEAMLERDHRERQRAGAHPLRLRPGGDELDRFQAVLGEHVAEPLARAVAPARDDDPEPAPAQRPDVRGRRLEHVDVLVLPLGSEVAPDPAAAVESLARPTRTRTASVARAGRRASRSRHSSASR